MTIDLTGTARPGALARAGWTTLGLLSVGVGGVGIIVPGLPTLGPLVRWSVNIERGLAFRVEPKPQRL